LSFVLQGMSGQTSQIAAVACTLVMVAIFRPLRVQVDRALEHRFGREQYEYASTIKKASGILVSIIELEELLNRLLDTVMEAVQIERGLILLKEREGGDFSVAVARGYGEDKLVFPVESDHPLIESLMGRPLAIQKNDVEELAEFGGRRRSVLSLMEDMGVVLVAPVTYERRIIGLLCLGEKKSGAWYSTDDVELLQTLMSQAAVSIDNARKVEELKKMVALEISFRELKRLDEMKDNFLSMVSHDLRTPMTSIKGYASILLEKIDKLNQQRQEKYLGVIIKEADRLTRLIGDLLDLQRLEAGKMKLDFKEVDLVEAARESVESFRGAALAKNISLEQALPGDGVLVKVDRDRISQVIANLLSNAIKFTPEGGRVTLSLATEDGDDPGWVQVAVADNGPGIPRDEQAKLFDKFQQVDKLVRGKEQGSGLGLSLVREIVRRHNGEVGVKSEPGSGSEFFFRLPLKMDEDK